MRGISVADLEYLDRAYKDTNDIEMNQKFIASMIRSVQCMAIGLKDEGLNKPFEELELGEIVTLVNKGSLH